MIPLDPLVAVRAIHFAATAVVTGAVIFLEIVAPRSLFAADGARVLRARLMPVIWLALAVAIASEFAWLLLLAVGMSGRTLAESFDRDLLWVVLSQTQSG